MTVRAGALARTGQPLARPARAVFLTRGATTGTVTATEPVGSSVALTTGFVVTFAQPVDGTTVQTAIRLDPPTPGIVRSSSPTEAPARYTFQPLAPLRPDVDYRLIVSGVRDADGVPLDTIRLTVHTTTAPGVVRFRPLDGTANVAALRGPVGPLHPGDGSAQHGPGVRPRRSGARPVAGTVRWAEHDTVLVFTPSSPLPAGKTVSMTVSTVARNTAGVHLAAAGHDAFKTATSGTTATSARRARRSASRARAVAGARSVAAAGPPSRPTTSA